MIRFLLLLFTLQLTLFAYNDYDLDGVEDTNDRCPNTPFSELVDANGCTISSTTSLHNFDFIYGISFTDSDYSGENTKTTSHSFQFDYYYKDFSLELSTSYMSSKSTSYNENGIDDSFVGAYYQFLPIKNLKISTGVGVIIPTYDSNLNNNNTDYTASLSASYALENINIFAGYIYTKVNDDDINNTDIIVNYQDTNAYSIGVGFYPTQRLYVSGSYFISDSVYKTDETIKTISAYAFYTIDSKWFTTFSYANGLSDSANDNYLSLRLGYRF
ncbi:DUF3187 domain-containing protein [Sulfurimonas sp.]|uniref:DUF3187 domain-containing protein n=1 Tax=Sulfurimonas sp. TaxID=2022749 RepID=UPI0035647B87